MRCEVKDCINNLNGYCDIDSYVTIQDDGTCDSMFINSTITTYNITDDEDKER